MFVAVADVVVFVSQSYFVEMRMVNIFWQNTNKISLNSKSISVLGIIEIFNFILNFVSENVFCLPCYSEIFSLILLRFFDIYI